MTSGPWENYGPQAGAAPDASAAPADAVPAAPADTSVVHGPWENYGPQADPTAAPAAAGSSDPGAPMAHSTYLGAAARFGERVLPNLVGAGIDALRGFGHDLYAPTAIALQDLGNQATGGPGIKTSQVNEMMQAPESVTPDVVNLANKYAPNDIRMAQDSSWFQKKAEQIAPWVALAIGTRGRSILEEAPTAAKAASGLLWEGGKAGLGAVASQLGGTGLGAVGQTIEQIAGGSGEHGRELGETVGSLAGGNVLNAVDAAALKLGKKFALSDAPKTTLAGEREGTTVSPDMLIKGGSDVMGAVRNIPVVSSLFSGQAAKSLTEQEAAALKLSSDVAKQPITRPLTDGEVGDPLVQKGVATHLQSLQEEKAGHQAVESAIGQNTPTEVQPILNELDKQIAAAGSDDVRNTLIAHKRSLENNIAQDNPNNAAIPGLQLQANSIRLANASDALRHQIESQMHNSYMNDGQPVILNAKTTAAGMPDPADYIYRNQGRLTPDDKSNAVRSQMNNGAIAVTPNMPDYQAFKLAIKPAPVAPTARQVPPVPTRSTKVQWGKLKTFKASVRKKTTAGGPMLGAHIPIHDAIDQAMEAQGNAVGPGLGTQWRQRSKTTAIDRADKRRDLSLDLTGENRPIEGQPSFPRPVPGASVGKDIARMSRAGGDTGLANRLSKHLGQEEVSKALGRDMSQKAYIGQGEGTVQGTTFRPQQWANELSKYGEDNIKLMERNTPPDAKGRSVGERMADQEQLAKVTGQPQEAGGLKKSIMSAAALAGASGRPIATTLAALGAIRLNHLMKGQQVQRYISRLPPVAGPPTPASRIFPRAITPPASGSRFTPRARQSVKMQLDPTAVVNAIFNARGGL